MMCASRFRRSLHICAFTGISKKTLYMQCVFRLPPPKSGAEMQRRELTHRVFNLFTLRVQIVVDASKRIALRFFHADAHRSGTNRERQNMIQATAIWNNSEIGYGESEFSLVGAIDEAICDLIEHPMYPHGEIEILVRRREDEPRFRLDWWAAVSLATTGNL